MTARAQLSVEARHGHLAMLTFSALVAGSFSLGGQVANEIDPAALNAKNNKKKTKKIIQKKEKKE